MLYVNRHNRSVIEFCVRAPLRVKRTAVRDRFPVSGWSGSALAGVWYYLPLGKGAFAFQPELSAGVVVRGIQTQDDMQDMPSGAYVDFAVQLAPSFRFSPASLKGFEFELSPVYTIIPVQGNFVTHNVNTPLALLENRIAELVDNDSFMEAVDKDTVDDIEESVSEIHDIIQNVLISFRISDGRYMNTAQKINVSHVFESVKPQAQMKASLKQQQLVWICPPTIEEVSCNEHALRGILVNLIDNAIKFSPAQNGKVTVCAEKNKDGTIVISVNDNGPGIPKEKRAVIFEKFADRGTVPSANEKSIGLGLYVAHELAAMNGISLSYRDGETGGACFSLTF